MAYDEDLANRVRERVADMPDMTEKQMFGGLGFLVAGNVAVTVSFRGGLMVRVDKTKSDRWWRRPRRPSSRCVGG